MLSGETDPLNAILTVHPGAGGAGVSGPGQTCCCACICAGPSSPADSKPKSTDYQDGEEAGIKSATITISGEFALGQPDPAKPASAGSRVSSPFDQAKSSGALLFASVFGFSGDRRLDRDRHRGPRRPSHRHHYRSGGKGGQHVNTTDPAVRIQLRPDFGIVTQCSGTSAPSIRAKTRR